MKNKQKYSVHLAFIFAFLASLIIQPLAAQDISPGQTVQGALGDGNDIVFSMHLFNNHPTDFYLFNAKAGESYVITVSSLVFPMMSMFNQNDTQSAAFTPLHMAELFADSSEVVDPKVKYTVKLKQDGQYMIFVFARDPATTGQYTLTLESGVPTAPGNGSTPSVGVWRGKIVAFNVSGDGSKITKNSSALVDDDGTPYSMIVGPIPGKGNCTGNVTSFFLSDIPIVSGAFEYNVGDDMFTFNIDGTFTTATKSSGQLSYELDGGVFDCSGSFQKSGSWQAQASSSARSLSTTAIVSPAHVIYQYSETGEIKALHVLYHPASE